MSDLTTERTDLNIIAGDEDESLRFHPERVEDAAEEFLALDPYTYIMTTPLFAAPEATIIARVLETRAQRTGSWDARDEMIAVLTRVASDISAGMTDPVLLLKRHGVAADDERLA